MARAEQIKSLTKELVGIPSMNESRRPDGAFNENVIAEHIHGWFNQRGIPSFEQLLPDGRKNVFAYVEGQSPQTVVLAGHFDTVAVNEYQALGLDPFDTDRLAQQQHAPEGYMVGRGALDMKSGIANAMVLMDEWHKQQEGLPGSALFVATCDEENNSYGILNAADVLLGLKEGTFTDPNLEKQVKSAIPSQLDLLGVINLDYTTSRYPSDESYHIWHGTIGKTLPSILVRGVESHVGEHFSGFPASSVMTGLLGAIEGNMDFANGNVPPTVLKVTDGRSSYDVMTPSTVKAYINWFTTEATPTEIIETIENEARTAVANLTARVDENYQEYCQRMGIPYEAKEWASRVQILRYSHLAQRYVKEFGDERLQVAIDESTAASPSTDLRDRSFAVVERLMNELKITDPTVMLFYSPPFYPYIKPDTDGLRRATEAQRIETEDKHDVSIKSHPIYPYISDMSYLQLDPDIAASIEGLTSEMPMWRNGYWIDLDKVRRLNLPVVNIGPHGSGAHHTNETVEEKYSFEILPDLVRGVAEKLWLNSH